MKGKKIILPVLLTSMVVSPVAANIATAVNPVFADSMTAPEVVVKNNLLDSYKAGEEIPHDQLPTVTTAVAYTVVIYGPNGKEYSFTKAEYEAEGFTFTPQVKGVYTFVFKAAAEGSVTLCDNITINVTEDSYKIEKVVNDYWALPTEVPTGSTLGLSVPKLTKNGESVEVAEFTGTIDQTTGAVSADATGVVVTVVRPGSNGSVAQYLTNWSAATASAPAHYSFEADVAGSYSVKYDYYVAGKKVATIAKQTVRALANYDIDAQFKLGFNWVGSIDTLVNKGNSLLGTTQTLPQVKPINSKASTTDEVNAYTEVTVTYLGGEGASEAEQALVGTDAAKQVVTNYLYTFKWVGSYKLEYVVKLPNLGVTSSTYTAEVKISKDATIPTAYLTSSYSWDDAKKVATFGTEELDTDALSQEEIISAISDYDRTSFAGVYELSGEGTATVTIPAIFAVDNYDTPSAIHIDREVYRKGATSDKLIVIGENDVTQEVTLKFATEADSATNTFKYGDFVVRYIARDLANNTSKNYYYYFSVKANGEVEAGVPTVYMQYFDNTKVATGDTVSVTKPTAVDYKSQDSNLEISTYYYVGDPVADNTELLAKIGAGAVKLKESSLKDGKYSFEVPTATAGQKLYVFATARNNYNYSNPGLVVRTFSIKGTYAGDEDAPVFSVVGEGIYTTYMQMLGHANEYDINDEPTGLDYDSILDTGLLSNGKAPFGQSSVVFLPSVKFEENTTNGLNVSVKLYYNDTQDYTKTTTARLLVQPSVTKTVSGSTETYTVNGGSFEATYAGMYTVVYTATDAAGNTTSQGYGILVNDTVAPTIVVVDKAKFADEHEVGTQFTVPEAQIRDNGQLLPLGEGDVEWYLEAPNHSYVAYNGTEGFTPYDTGDYYVYYKAKDSADNEAVSQKYHISVVAKQTLTIDLATNAFDVDYEWAENTQSVEVEIPNAICVMPELSEAVSVSIKVTNSSNREFTVTNVDEKYSKFTATAEGVYTVTYSAQDRFGRKAADVILSISVGDSTGPVASWKSTSNLPASEVETGSTWKFDISMLDVTDDSGATIGNGITFTETMRAPDGTVVTKNDSGEYVFDQTGTYSFTLRLTDKSGNSTPVTLSISAIAAKEDSTTHTSNVVSTVLIVLSVVVLAGVVTYFVLSGRKKTVKTSKSSKEEK